MVIFVARLFNHLRCRHLLGPSKRHLMATGTTANESLHSEINEWFRNQSEVFSTTVELQLSVNCIGKLLAHNAALYHPTLIQRRHSDVLVRVAAALGHDAPAWQRFCADLIDAGAARPCAASLPLGLERRAILRKIKSVRARPDTAAASKRPASCLKKPSCCLKRPAAVVTGPHKRTVYSLKRTGSLCQTR